MQYATPHATPATDRDYARQTGYRPARLRRAYYRWSGDRQLLAPLLGFIMYIVLVLMMSVETQLWEMQTLAQM